MSSGLLLAEDPTPVLMHNVTPAGIPEQCTDLNTSCAIAHQLAAFSFVATALRALADEFDASAAGRISAEEIVEIGLDRAKRLAEAMHLSRVTLEGLKFARHRA